MTNRLLQMGIILYLKTSCGDDRATVHFGTTSLLSSILKIFPPFFPGTLPSMFVGLFKFQFVPNRGCFVNTRYYLFYISLLYLTRKTLKGSAAAGCLA